MAMKAHKVQMKRLLSSDAEVYKVKYEDTFTSHHLRLKMLISEYTQVVNNYYYELLFGATLVKSQPTNGDLQLESSLIFRQQHIDKTLDHMLRDFEERLVSSV